MKEKRITIGVLAHVDAGKTTLTEQLLCHGGALRQAGSVDRGTARTDFLSVERERGISVRTSTAVLEYQGTELNLIDTPGHVDFAAEVERSLSVLDMAVLVISAVEGVQAQTEILYEALCRAGVRVVFFINKIDRVGSRWQEVAQEIREQFTPHVVVCSQVCGEETRECSAAACSFTQEAFAAQVLDEVSDFGEAIMEQYLEEGSVPPEKLEQAFAGCVARGELFPVLCGSSLLDVGVQELLDFLTRYGAPVKNRADNALSGVVYQITHDKTMGRVAHVRLFGGSIQNRDTVPFHTPGSETVQQGKVSQIRRYSGGRASDLGQVSQGQVAALCGLSNAKVGDILGEAAQMTGTHLAEPLLKVRVLPAGPEQLHPVLEAFRELDAEDPALGLEYYPDEQEMDVCITGTVQLEVLEALVRERYGLSVQFSPPTVLYRETPSSAGRGFEAYTMPKPCWAIIELEIEPLPRGSGFVYEAHVPNNQIFYRYQNHVKEAMPRALKQGLYNWPVVDLKVSLVGGSHHTIHTHPLDFFLATPMAFMNGLVNTGSTLLEPIQTLRITAQEELAGKLIGDVIAMRGSFDTPVIRNGSVTLEARVPVSESMDYAVRIASLTSGRGVLSARFAGYEVCPSGLGAVAKRHGVNPLDREKWILTQRSAMAGAGGEM